MIDSSKRAFACWEQTALVDFNIYSIYIYICIYIYIYICRYIYIFIYAYIYICINVLLYIFYYAGLFPWCVLG